MNISKENVKYVDIPEVSESFVDALGKTTFDGLTLRMEMCVTRVDDVKPPKAPTGKKYPVCRLVMPPGTAVELYNALNQLIGVMVKQGLVKKEDAPKGVTH